VALEMWAGVRKNRQNMEFLPAGLHSARSAAMPVLRYTQWSKVGFTPRRGDTLPDKREIWHGGADSKFAPPCQISRSLGQKY